MEHGAPDTAAGPDRRRLRLAAALSTVAGLLAAADLVAAANRPVFAIWYPWTPWETLATQTLPMGIVCAAPAVWLLAAAAARPVVPRRGTLALLAAVCALQALAATGWVGIPLVLRQLPLSWWT